MIKQKNVQRSYFPIILAQFCTICVVVPFQCFLFNMWTIHEFNAVDLHSLHANNYAMTCQYLITMSM